MRALLVGLGLGIGILAVAPVARAGLYYSGETMAELPSQWRGFLVDQRMLRGIAVKPAATAPASPARTRYEAAATKLATTAKDRAPIPEEPADLGAPDRRLGAVGTDTQ